MNPFSFESVCKTMNIINKAIYGVETYKEEKTRLQDECPDCQSINCICDAEREYWQEREATKPF